MAEETESDYINRLLIQVSRLHFKRLHTMMETIGLHRGQPPLLHILWEEEGHTQSDLAARLHIQPATVTKMLQRMEQAGFVERRPDPEDQRVSRVYLTEAGRTIRTDVCRVNRQIGEELAAGFTPEEEAQFTQLLGQVRENLLQVEGGEPCFGHCQAREHPHTA